MRIVVLQVPAWTTRARGEVVGREALPQLAAPWTDLCARSAEANVYYSPRYARALLDHVEPHTPLRAALAWDGDKLLGFLPFTRSRPGIPVLQAAGQAWRSKYTFSCTPLLDESRPVEAATTLLEALASVQDREWVLPTLNVHGPACRAMIAALDRVGRPWSFSNAFERAALEHGSDFDTHMRSCLPSKRRKELERNRRRLGDLGTLTHEAHVAGEGLSQAVAAFLDLEAGGWKGRRGTALACHQDTRRFALEVFAPRDGASICRADVLRLDGRPIAVGLIVFAGRTGFTVKGAYDESLRSYAPGLILEIEVIRSFLSEGWADRLDAGTSGAHVIDRLWSGRMEVADLAFSLSGSAAAWRLTAFDGAAKLRRRARNAAKESLARVRSRRGT